MTAIACLLTCMLMAASPASRPDEMPPVVSPMNLSDAALLQVRRVEGPDSILLLRDGRTVGARLAGVTFRSQDSSSRAAATTFLERVLTGERVWLVPADPSGSSSAWYVYRWPDRLLVNLELVRQGYADAEAGAEASAETDRMMAWWRDHARRHGKGIWAARTAAEGERQEGGTPEAAKTARTKEPIARSKVVSAATSPADEAAMVYVTPNGKKYHRANCRSMRATKSAVALDAARRNYEPCKQCDPPQ